MAQPADQAAPPSSLPTDSYARFFFFAEKIQQRVCHGLARSSCGCSKNRTAYEGVRHAVSLTFMSEDNNEWLQVDQNLRPAEDDQAELILGNGFDRHAWAHV